MSDYVPRVLYPISGQPDNQELTLYDRLLQKRLIFLNQAMGSELANQTIATLLYLDTEGTGQDISLYINSLGGSGREALTAGLAIYDTIQCVNSDVVTVCTGLAAGIMTFLVATGAPGKRLALPHARLMLSQPRQVIPERSVTDIAIEAKELMQLQQMLTTILVHRTGQTIEQILEATEREGYLSAQAAHDKGLIDRIVSR